MPPSIRPLPRETNNPGRGPVRKFIICAHWDLGTCRGGDNCSFAHSEEELASWNKKLSTGGSSFAPSGSGLGSGMGSGAAPARERRQHTLANFFGFDEPPPPSSNAWGSPPSAHAASKVKAAAPKAKASAAPKPFRTRTPETKLPKHLEAFQEAYGLHVSFPDAKHERKLVCAKCFKATSYRRPGAPPPNVRLVTEGQLKGKDKCPKCECVWRPLLVVNVKSGREVEWLQVRKRPKNFSGIYQKCEKRKCEYGNECMFAHSVPEMDEWNWGRAKKNDHASADESGNKVFPMEAGDWLCHKCNNHNFKMRKVCNLCSTPKQELLSEAEDVFDQQQADMLKEYEDEQARKKREAEVTDKTSVKEEENNKQQAQAAAERQRAQQQEQIQQQHQQQQQQKEQRNDSQQQPPPPYHKAASPPGMSAQATPWQGPGMSAQAAPFRQQQPRYAAGSHGIDLYGLARQAWDAQGSKGASSQADGTLAGVTHPVGGAPARYELGAISTEHLVHFENWLNSIPPAERLTEQNYRLVMHNLLVMEQHARQAGRNCDMTWDAPSKRVNLLGLHPEYLSKLKCGDIVTLTVMGSSALPQPGVVVSVFPRFFSAAVHVSQDPKLWDERVLGGQYVRGQVWLPRTDGDLFRAFHRAVDRVDVRCLFPTLQSVKTGSWDQKDHPELSEEIVADLSPAQRRVVQSIVSPRLSRVPTLVEGPFGTGKTRTMMAVAQALARAATSDVSPDRPIRVLICTHTNSAADNYTEGFSQGNWPREQVLRLLYAGRSSATLTEHCRKYSRYGRDKGGNGGGFITPSLAELRDFRFVVTTNATAASLVTAGVGPSFFSHVIIDEADQAMEAELLVPLSLAGEQTKICLVGDHKQMGTDITTMAPASRALLVNSLLGRLSSMAVYHDPDAAFCRAHFRTVYRSHSEIVSALQTFYPDVTLVCAANEATVPCVLQHTENRFFFVHVRGKEDFGGGVGSMPVNIAEAHEVTTVVRQILKHRVKRRLQPKDICVLSPFFSQTRVIRAEMRKAGLGGVLVHNLDNVQGLEFKVVVLSCVRSAPGENQQQFSPLTSQDLSSPGRINTAISRASSLVVVIGDRDALPHMSRAWNMVLANANMQWSQTISHKLVAEVATNDATVLQRCLEDTDKHIKPLLESREDRELQFPVHLIHDQYSAWHMCLEQLQHQIAQYAVSLKAAYATSNSNLSALVKGDKRSRVRKTPLLIRYYPNSGPAAPPLPQPELPEEESSDEEEDVHPPAYESAVSEAVGAESARKKQIPPRPPVVTEEADADAVDSLLLQKHVVWQCAEQLAAWSLQMQRLERRNALHGDDEEKKEEDGRKTQHYLKGVLHVTAGGRSQPVYVSPADKRAASALGVQGEVMVLSDPQYRNRALHGDAVVLELLEQDQVAELRGSGVEIEDWRSVGRVIAIKKSMRADAATLLVCTACVVENSHGFLFEPLDGRAPLVYVPDCATAGINVVEHRSKRDLFLVKIEGWAIGESAPRGSISELLPVGNPLYATTSDMIEAGRRRVRAQFGIAAQAWPSRARMEESLREPSPGKLEQERLVYERVFGSASAVVALSTDGALCADFALSASPTSDGALLVGIHIADVASVLKQDSALDMLARQRGASARLPGGAPFAMLPEAWGEAHVSLDTPGHRRLAVSMAVRILPTGQLQGSPVFFATAIQPACCLTLLEAQNILDGRGPAGEAGDQQQQRAVLFTLGALGQAAMKLHTARQEAGTLDSIVDNVCARREKGQESSGEATTGDSEWEVQFSSDDGKLSQLIVKEFSELYNATAAAALLSAPGVPAGSVPLVSQPAPRDWAIEQFWDWARVSLKLPVLSGRPHLGAIIRSVGGGALGEAVRQLALQQLQLPQEHLVAVTDEVKPQDYRHYGQNISATTWATSPLHRYVDLLVQRLLLAHVVSNRERIAPGMRSAPVSVAPLLPKLQRRIQNAQQAEVQAGRWNAACVLQRSPRRTEAIVRAVDNTHVWLFIPNLPFLRENELCVPLSSLGADVRTQGPGSPGVVVPAASLLPPAVPSLPDNFEMPEEGEPGMSAPAQQTRALQRQQLASRRRRLLPLAVFSTVQIVVGGVWREEQHDMGFQLLWLGLSSDKANGANGLNDDCGSCLLHRVDPASCFSPGSAEDSQLPNTFSSAQLYRDYWATPLQAEAAARAMSVQSGGTVHRSVQITWTGDFHTGKAMIPCTRLPAVHDLVCVRSMGADGAHIWHGHVAAVERLPVATPVFAAASVTFVRSSIGAGFQNPDTRQYTVEFISIPSSLRYAQQATASLALTQPTMRLLGTSAAGRQPHSALADAFSVPMRSLHDLCAADQSLPEQLSSLDPHQVAALQTIIAPGAAPVQAVQGVPHSGKSQTSVVLLRLFAVGNRLAAEQTGTPRVTVYAGPDEHSVDLMTGKMLQLNRDRVVRVFTRAVEEQEHPPFAAFRRLRTMLGLPGDGDEGEGAGVLEPRSPLRVAVFQVSMHSLVRDVHKCKLAAQLLDLETRAPALLHEASTGNEATRAHVSQFVTRYFELLAAAEQEIISIVHIVLCVFPITGRPSLRRALDGSRCVTAQVVVGACEQALEPEVMTAASLAAQTVVLCGDHRVAGPACVAEGNNVRPALNRSLMERWCSAQPPLLLRRNYLLHPAISSFAGMEFYEGLLEDDRSVAMPSALPLADALTNVWVHGSKHPLRFVANEGVERTIVPGGAQDDLGQDGGLDAPGGHDRASDLEMAALRSARKSYVNLVEARRIVEDVMRLMSAGQRVRAFSVLVLTPYVAQERLITTLLAQSSVATKALEYGHVPLNPAGATVAVESVQGSRCQVADVVLLSTVRSQQGPLTDKLQDASQLQGLLGPLSDARLLNEAITCARQGLVVYGNRQLLSLHRSWRNLLVHCDHELQANN